MISKLYEYIPSGFNPFMPNRAFNICCPRDCVSRHNGGTSGAPLKPLRVDSALKALSRGLRGAPAVPPLLPRDAVSRTANVGTVGINGLTYCSAMYCYLIYVSCLWYCRDGMPLNRLFHTMQDMNIYQIRAYVKAWTM